MLQGETRVSSDPNVVLTTILGSCVTACIWDPEAGVGGLNHFLLPGCDNSPKGALGYGVQAMELLVNGLIRAGAARSRLKVKLLGGAKMSDGGIEIGEENAKFALWFVENEGFELIDTCLGGQQGRSIRFWPVTGRIQRRFMPNARELHLEDQPRRSKSHAAGHSESGGDVQLF